LHTLREGLEYIAGAALRVEESRNESYFNMVHKAIETLEAEERIKFDGDEE
jgi:hypothetical protein